MPYGGAPGNASLIWKATSTTFGVQPGGSVRPGMRTQFARYAAAARHDMLGPFEILMHHEQQFGLTVAQNEGNAGIIL